MTAVSPLTDGKSEVIEMGDKNSEQELNSADNDDNDDYIDNDDNNDEDSGQPKGDLKRRRPTIRKKIDEVHVYFSLQYSSIFTNMKCASSVVFCITLYSI